MLVEVQNSILKMVAQGDDLNATLYKLCCELEGLFVEFHQDLTRFSISRQPTKSV